MSTMSYAGHPSTTSLDFLVFDVYRSYIEEHVNLLQVAEMMPCMKEVLFDMRKVDTSVQAAQIFLNTLKQNNEVEKYKELAEALLHTEYEVLYCALDCGPVCFASAEHKKVMSLFSRRVEETFSPSEVAEQLACRGVLAIENFQAIKSLEENGNIVDAIFLLFDSLARQNENWYEHLLEMADCCEFTKLVNELDPTYYDRKGKSAESYQEKARPEASKVFFAQDDRLVNMKSISDVGSVSEAKMQASTMSGWKTPKYGPTTPDIRPNSALSTSRKGTSYMGMEPTVQMNAMYMDQQVLSNEQGMDGRNTATTDSRATTMYAEQVIDGRTESRAASMYTEQCVDGRSTGAPVSRVASMYPEQGMDVKNTGAPVSRGSSTYPEQCVDGRNTGAPASRVSTMYPEQGIDVRNTGAPVSRVASTYPEQCVDGRNTGAPVSRAVSMYHDQGMDVRNTGAPASRVASMYPDQGTDGRNTGVPANRVASMYPDQGTDGRNTGVTASRVASMYPDQGTDGRNTGVPASRVASMYPDQGTEGRNTGVPASRVASMYPDQGTDGRNTGVPASRVASMYPDQGTDGRNTGVPASRVASMYPDQGTDGRNTGVPASRVASMYPEQGTDGRNTGVPASRVASMYPEESVDCRNTGAPVSRVASIYPDQGVNVRNTGGAVSRVASAYPEQGTDGRNTGAAVSRVASTYPDQGADGRSSAPVSSRPPSTYPEQGMDNRSSKAAGSRAASQYQVSNIRNQSARESRANVPFSEQGIDCARIASEYRAAGIYTEPTTDCNTLAELQPSSEVGATSASRVGSAAPERRLTSKSTDSIRGTSRTEMFERPQSRTGSEEPMGKKSYTEAQKSQSGSANPSRQALVRVASYSPTSRPSSAGATIPSDAHKVSVTCQGRPQQADGGCKYCIGNLPCSLCHNKVRSTDAAQAGGVRPSSSTNDPRYTEQHHRHHDQPNDRRNTNAPVILDSQLGCVRQQLTELTNLMLKQMSVLGNVNGKVDRLEVNVRRLLEHHH